MTIEGKNLIVYVQGDGETGETDELYPIACDRNCSLVINSEFIETTVKDNGYNKTFLPTLVSYQITGDGLTDYSKVMGTQSLQSKILKRRLVSFKFEARQSDTEAVIYSGQGYLQEVSLSGPVNGSATFSYQLIGYGELDIENTIPVEGGGGTPVEDMAQLYPLQFTATTAQKTYQNNALIGATLVAFYFSGYTIYSGSDSDEYSGFNATTGTISWEFESVNDARGLILYKK